MNCDGIRGLLSAYLDGELSPGDLLRVEQHLRRCHSCADEVDSLRQTVALVAALDEVEVPAAFHLQLHERLVALGPTPALTHIGAARRPRYAPGRFAIPAAAAAAVLTIGLLSTHAGGNLPGAAAVPGKFDPAPVVASSTPAQEPASGTSTAPISPPAVAVKPPASAPEQSTSASPAPTTNSAGPAAPLGPLSPNPSGASVASASGPATGIQATQLAPQLHYQAKVALTANQIEALASHYQIDAQNGESFISVPTKQFADLLKQIKALPGAAQVGTTESINIAADLADAQAQVQETEQQLERFQAAYSLKSPAEQAQEQAQLEADKQAAADAKTQLDALVKQAETSTIFLQVVNR